MKRLSRFLTAACGLLLAAGTVDAAGRPRHLKKNGSAQRPATATRALSRYGKVFDAIEGNQLEVAMQQTEMLIKAIPTSVWRTWSRATSCWRARAR